MPTETRIRCAGSTAGPVGSRASKAHVLWTTQNEIDLPPFTDKIRVSTRLGIDEATLFIERVQVEEGFLDGLDLSSPPG